MPAMLEAPSVHGRRLRAAAWCLCCVLRVWLRDILTCSCHEEMLP
jgi:hypothetical protein